MHHPWLDAIAALVSVLAWPLAIVSVAWIVRPRRPAESGGNLVHNEDKSAYGNDLGPLQKVGSVLPGGPDARAYLGCL